MDYIIQNATIVNEGSLSESSVYIHNGIIAAIGDCHADNATVVDGTGCYLLPGVIDTHVHFREPGLTHKADFATESLAAVAGGVTSVIEMPNTVPQTTSIEQLEAKERIAATKCHTNYGFMIGATNDNIAQLLALPTHRYAAIKLFLGSSTGNMLVNDPERLDLLFRESQKLIVAHCEEEAVVQANLANFKMECQGTPRETAALHPQIRNTEACFLSTYKAIERARHYHTRLHIAHISTATELDLFSNQSIDQKHITAEVTPNHLWFDDRDYETLGNKIKCNPAIKSNNDRLALWAALYDGIIDTIGTDHAPHTLQEKEKPYFDAPGGIPSIQHSLPLMLEGVFNSGIQQAERQEFIAQWLPLMVEKMCHNPATIFGIRRRGFIREGYHADLVLVRPAVEQTVTANSLYYKCGWSPLEGMTLHSRVEQTFVNGTLAYTHSQGACNEKPQGLALEFDR